LAAGALWQLIIVIERVPDFLLPGPAEIWQSGVAERDVLLSNALPTAETAVIGFIVALAVGFVLAVLIHRSRVLELALYPIVIASQTVPVLALAPILVVIFGFTLLPKLIVVALVCFFPITVNTVDGLKSVDPDLIDMMRTLGAGRARLFRDVELPSALPYLFSGAKVAVTFSVIGALFGEWVGSFEGLGYLMTQQRSQFDTGGLFAAMALLTMIGVVLFLVVALLERLLLPWYRNDGDALFGSRQSSVR
jgi:ABC-type nitrate/sulfonate/bicarbonate transport system permease component